MLKIIEVHPATNTQGEYIVLQNQGLVTVSLRGWALCTDAYLESDPARMAQEMYVFREEVPIKPYTRVVLFTGNGEDEWVPTIDGRQAYCAYWNRRDGSGVPPRMSICSICSPRESLPRRRSRPLPPPSPPSCAPALGHREQGLIKICQETPCL